MRDEGIVRTASNRGGIQSSVRSLNRSLKWGNERNPRCLLHVSGETAPLKFFRDNVTKYYLNIFCGEY